MQALIKQINQLKPKIKSKVDQRLKEFQDKTTNKEWFSELCFCLLTANTSAELGIRIQNELGYKGFTGYKDENQLAKRLKDAKYRFYNRRAHFINLANKHKDIKTILSKQENKREWLVNNIKGLGYKESSHFLRNIGFNNYAILDKHILNLLEENNIIQKPKTLNKSNYLEIENKLKRLGKQINMTMAELDLYLWYMKTGKVLK